jgi:hypothetical protein
MRFNSSTTSRATAALPIAAGSNNREQSVRRLAQELSAVSTAKPKLFQPTDRRAQSPALHQPHRHAICIPQPPYSLELFADFPNASLGPTYALQLDN